MGAAGRDRAVKFYDWSVIIPRYEALWAELGERRSKDSEIAAAQEGQVADPLRNDPSQVFSGYPTMSLGEDFQVSRQGTDTELETLIQFKINSAVAGLVPDAPNMRALLKVLPNADASTDVGTLLVSLKAPPRSGFSGHPVARQIGNCPAYTADKIMPPNPAGPKTAYQPRTPQECGPDRVPARIWRNRRGFRPRDPVTRRPHQPFHRSSG